MVYESCEYSERFNELFINDERFQSFSEPENFVLERCNFLNA